MDLDELRARRAKLQRNTDITFENMDKLAHESYRVADVAYHSKEILDDLDAEFEKQTGLKGPDIAFLFAATALQCLRIFLINKLTEIDKAGQGNAKEDALHKVQEKILGKFDNGQKGTPDKYYAPLNQIITGRGVPYDATSYAGENLHLFKGANHRFATLGHDPIIGLIFGTGNILTNTITCVKTPIITTNHVIYDSNLKNPRIAGYGSTLVMLKSIIDRLKDDPASVAAALIKQIIHIGTDLYTPCGIQIPGANLILSNTNAEILTRYISTGDLIKAGTSMQIAIMINSVISMLHMLTYDESKYASRDVFSVKTRKIIMYSNTIATASNVIWVGANIAAGNESAIKELDIGGLIITIQRLITDTKFIREVKKEFVFGSFNKMIQGEDLKLKEIESWD